MFPDFCAAATFLLQLQIWLLFASCKFGLQKFSNGQVLIFFWWIFSMNLGITEVQSCVNQGAVVISGACIPTGCYKHQKTTHRARWLMYLNAEAGTLVGHVYATRNARIVQEASVVCTLLVVYNTPTEAQYGAIIPVRRCLHKHAKPMFPRSLYSVLFVHQDDTAALAALRCHKPNSMSTSTHRCFLQ